MGKQRRNKKRKATPRTPRRLRWTRPQRLQCAAKWIATYRGKRIVVAYATWFGVDRQCAIAELRTLGVDVPLSEDAIAATMVVAAKERRAARKRRTSIPSIAECETCCGPCCGRCFEGCCAYCGSCAPWHRGLIDIEMRYGESGDPDAMDLDAMDLGAMKDSPDIPF